MFFQRTVVLDVLGILSSTTKQSFSFYQHKLQTQNASKHSPTPSFVKVNFVK